MKSFFAPTRRELIAAPFIPRIAAFAAAKRDILAGSISAEKLKSILLSRENWHPYPAAAERAKWEALPPAVLKLLVETGETALKTEWPLLPATLFLEYARIGNRSHYEKVNGIRRVKLRELVIAECAEGKGRFLDEIANGVWATCEETFWGYPAHLNAQKARTGLPDVSEPIVDLFAAETGSLMAWTMYLIGPAFDKVSKLIRPRIHLEIDRRILSPCLDRDDFGWMGLTNRGSLNNWTPWINSNWLTCALLTERDEKRRAAAVHKSMRCVDNWLNQYDDDGGCDEGPGYWNAAGGALFDCLELIYSATSGAASFYQVPLVKEIGRYIYRAHIDGNYYTNFADASAVVHLAGDMVFRYGQRIGDAKMSALGADAAARSDVAHAGSIGRELPAIFDYTTVRNAPASQPLVRDVWLPGIQVMAARAKEGSSKGLYLAAQGGHNAESHNHNDVGNFMVYSDGKPAIIDVGVETYSAKTFSSKRYEIWTMQSAYHNLPTIGGVMQSAGREFAAANVKYHADDAAAEFSLDISHAYPKTLGLKAWNRSWRFDRAKNEIVVVDSYDLAKAAAEITLTLMTPFKAAVTATGELTFSPTVKVHYDAKVFKPVVEEIRIEDSRLRSSWGERVYRVLLRAEKPPAAATWTMRIA